METQKSTTILWNKMVGRQEIWVLLLDGSLVPVSDWQPSKLFESPRPPPAKW